MDTPRTLYYIDASNPGTEPAADTGAALAAASIVFAEIDRNYSNRLRTKAVQVVLDSSDVHCQWPCLHACHIITRSTSRLPRCLTLRTTIARHILGHALSTARFLATM